MRNINFLLNDNAVIPRDTGDSALEPILALALEQMRQYLRDFATAPDFLADMQLAFGDSFAPETAFSLAQDWAKGDVTLPSIEILPAATLNGAYGGYVSATDTIYLSEEFLQENTLSAVTGAALEEFGHSVERTLNDLVEAPGDEGHIFAGLVQGISLPASELQALKAENDFATIVVDNQVLEIEQAVISGNGGQGGTTQTIPLEAAPLTLVKYNWENFFIPDEFRILYEGKQIAGNVGLQSGGGQGERIVVKNNSEELVVQVTAPLEGTAWNFTVETLPLEININGLLGDVIEVDVVKELQDRGVSLQDAGLNANNFGLQSNSNNRGEIAEIDNWQDELKQGKFYFVPTVDGSIRQLSQARNDNGLGESTLVVTNGNIEIPIEFNITDGFSTSGDSDVEVGANKLDIYRQQQRLAYFSFPDSGGNPLVVDGDKGSKTIWATRLFNIAASPRPLGKYSNGGRGRISDHPSTLKKDSINSSNAPQWKDLNGITNFTFVGTQRRFGTNFSAGAIQGGAAAFGSNLNSTGVSGKNGQGNPSKSHDGGRGVDIDTPGKEIFSSQNISHGNLFFRERLDIIPLPPAFIGPPQSTWYVAAPNNQIIINDNGTYRAGDPNNPAELAQGLTTANLVANGATILPQIANLLVDNTGYNPQNIINIINAFSGQGVGAILFNDPRTWSNGAQYSSGHWGHIHFEISVPAAAPQINSFLSLPNYSELLEKGDLLSNSNSVSLINAIDLGAFEGTQNLTGTIDANNPEQYYRFILGNPINGEEIEGEYFFTLRDFSLLLDGLSNDLDVELIRDYNEDGVRQDEEVVAISPQTGTNPELFTLTDLPENVYFIRVFPKGGDTNYNLTLTIPPLQVPPDGAGNSTMEAADLGLLTGNLQLSDFIGQVDPEDYYRFNLSAITDLDINVAGLQQGDLSLILGRDDNNDGAIDFDETIALSDAESNEPEVLNITGLEAGTYYIWLSRNSGNTDYNLSLSATPATIPPDLAGNSLNTAFDIGSLTGASNFSDFVGNVDPEDFYRFTLDSVSGLSIKLDGLGADADLELAQDTNNNGVIDTDEIIRLSELEGTAAEVIALNALAAGTYFVRVHQYEGDTNYNLSFEPTNPFGVDLSVNRTDSTGAVNLGEPFTYTLEVTNNGPSVATDIVLTENLPFGLGFDFVTGTISTPPIPLNYVDIFKFQLEAGERVTIDLDGNEFGSFLNSVLRLFDANGNELAISDDNPAPGEVFSLDSYLDFTASSSQTYYVGVSSSPNSAYDPFSESTGGDSSGSYTIDITVGSGGSTNQVTVSEPNNTIPEAFDTGLSSANPGTLLGSGFILTDDSFSGFIDPDNDLLTVNWAALASGQTATVELTFIGSTSGDRLSTASVTSNEYDYNPANNSLLSTKTIAPISPADADLELTQTVDNPNPSIGSQVTFTLTLTNQGPGTATQIAVQDLLPGELSFVAASANLGSYDSNTGIWTVGNMPPNQSVTLMIAANVDSGQSIANTAEVLAVNEGDPDSTPNNNDPNEDDFAAIILDIQNEVPLVQGNKTVTVLEDAPPTGLDISAPTDANGDPLNITVNIIPDPTKGEVRLADGLTPVIPGSTLTEQQLTGLLFVLVADANGSAGAFSYTVLDGQGGSASQTVTLAITPVNDPPLAQDDTETTNQDTPITVAVLANDSDPDGDGISLVSFQPISAGGGAVSRDENGTPGNLGDDKLVYTPPLGFTGIDTFTYTISDGIETRSATVNITVDSGSNQPPQAVNDEATATQNTPLVLPAATLLSNDTDPNPGDILSVTGVSNPANGSVLFDGTNAIFTPAPGFIGQAGFDYSITDGKGGNSSASVEITVNPFLGTPGRDTIAGTDFDDILIGDFGADNLTGKQGQDQFVYLNIRDAGDIIQDFEVGSDQIVLTDLLDSLGYGGSDPIADGYLKFGARGSDAVILIDPDGLAPAKRALPFITVEGVALAAMQNPNNFVF